MGRSRRQGAGPEIQVPFCVTAVSFRPHSKPVSWESVPPEGVFQDRLGLGFKGGPESSELED